jgi:peptidyl-prolyl cis-trans isomerase A (cyclophilin A)
MSVSFTFGSAASLLITSVLLLAQTPAGQQAASAKTTAPARPEREPGLYASITTSMGTIVAKLYEKESPITVKNFVDLALGRKEWVDPATRQKVKKPLYNGLIFHRVIPGFMIQGGDPLGTGTGGTDEIPDEFDPSLSFDRPGKLGMANAGPGTGSSQFFITEVPTPHLTGKHTIFGQVVDGQDVVEKIARVPRDSRDKPATPVRMIRVAINRVGPGPAVGTPTSASKPAGSKPAAAKKPAAGTKPAAAKKPAAGTKPAATRPAPTKPATTKPKTTSTPPIK